MKWILVTISLFLISPAAEVYAKRCDECPANSPCNVIVPKGDKCNTCEVRVHCSEDYWYQGEKKCTFLDCTILTPIENPFEQGGEEAV